MITAVGERFPTYANGFRLTVDVGYGGADPHWIATFTLPKEDWSATMEVRCEGDSLRASSAEPAARKGSEVAVDASDGGRAERGISLRDPCFLQRG